MRKIEKILFCFFICLYIAIPLNGVDKIIGFNIHIIILGICFILWILCGRRTSGLTHKYVIAKVVFFLAFFFSSFKLENTNYYGVSMDYVQDILFIIILCQPSKKEEYNQYLQAFVFGALLNSTLILLGESLGIEVSHWGDVDTKRLTILGRDPNEMGMVHCFAIAISLYLMRVGKNKLMKIINLIIAVLSAASILFTGSRTATIAVVVLIVINFILAKRKFGGFVVGLIVTILLAFSVYYFSTHFLDESILERYTSIGEELEEGTMASRTLIWAKCIDAFVNSDVVGMVFGHGYNTTPLYTFDNYDAHNVFLKVLVEYGIVGELLFLYLWFFFIRASLRVKNRDDRFLMISLLAMIFISFMTLSWIYNMLIWFVAILINLKFRYFVEVEQP